MDTGKQQQTSPPKKMKAISNDIPAIRQTPHPPTAEAPPPHPCSREEVGGVFANWLEISKMYEYERYSAKGSFAAGCPGKVPGRIPRGIAASTKGTNTSGGAFFSTILQNW
jgi:hypothetical protein